MTPQDLIEHFGTQTAAADALDLYKQQVNKWVKRGSIPLAAQIRIELATKHKLKADIDPALRRRTA